MNDLNWHIENRKHIDIWILPIIKQEKASIRKKYSHNIFIFIFKMKMKEIILIWFYLLVLTNSKLCRRYALFFNSIRTLHNFFALYLLIACIA